MEPEWAQVVADVLGRYTYDRNEVVIMIQRLKQDNRPDDWFALAMAQWCQGDVVKAATILTDGLEEMGYQRKERKGQ